ncbi:MAG: Fic family protein [Alphaproteobacteria bacterium]
MDKLSVIRQIGHEIGHISEIIQLFINYQYDAQKNIGQITMNDTLYRIEPTRLSDVPEAISDVVAELSAASAKLETALNPRTAASLAQMVRIMNTYYSNLIEGHSTRPRDIEQALEHGFDRIGRIPETAQIESALEGQYSGEPSKRSLLILAVAHVRVQEEVDKCYSQHRLAEPASPEFIRWLHREFYRGATDEMLCIQDNGQGFLMNPGEWRLRPEHDVAVGRHHPPASDQVARFMTYFAECYRFDRLGMAARILAIPAAHHRFNYIHPFPDGNGRVSRLMSHAMGHAAGIGAHGLWSCSRGLARGLESRGDYKRFLDHADTPRQGDVDGRGNLSQRAFEDFILWFLRVCLDQITFMSGLFEINTLASRFKTYVDRSERLKREALPLLQEALIRGEFDRGDAPRITRLPERTARRVLNDILAEGLLASETPKGPVSLRFPVKTQDILFPRLFTES